MLSKFIQKSQKGFGLLELMLSMVIVALLLIMATRYYNSTRNAARVQQGAALINQAYSAAQSMSIAQGDFRNVSTSAVQAFLTQQSTASPWPGATPLSATPAADPYNTLTIKLGTDGNVSCQALIAAFLANEYVSTSTPPACSASTTLSGGYDAAITFNYSIAGATGS